MKIRLSGEPADLENLAQVIKVIEESGLYANRRDLGRRC